MEVSPRVVLAYQMDDPLARRLRAFVSEELCSQSVTDVARSVMGADVVLVPLGVVDAGLDVVRAVKGADERVALVLLADCPQPAVVAAAFASGAHEVLDLSVANDIDIARVIDQARLRVMGQSATPGQRQRWVEERMHEAQAIAKVGSWEVDLATWSVEWSPEFRRIMGIRPDDEPLGVEGYAARTHRDDRDRVVGELLDLFQHGVIFDSDHRIVHPDGTEFHVHARGRCELAPDGAVTRAYGTTADVTELRSLEAAVRRERDLSRAILQAMQHGYCLTVDGKIVEVNDELCRITGFAREELLGTIRPYPFWDPDRYGEYFAGVDLAEAKGCLSLEIVLRHRSGRRFPAAVSIEAIEALDGHFNGFVASVRDITLQKQAEADLRKQATEDGLTGLLNRRGFDMVMLSKDNGPEMRVASLAVIDVDGFKEINDRYGHPVGDAVLAEIARRLDVEARSGDVLARVGGDEFAWVMPGADRVLALAAAERARAAIAAEPFPPGIPVTVSVGVAEMCDDDAYAAADTALYRAKRAGANRVVAVVDLQDRRRARSVK